MIQRFDPYHVWLAIPPEDQPPNHYRLLGLPLFEDSDETIEHAADQRMKHLRDFQAGKHSALSQKLLNEVSAARVCLLNPKKKAAYDVWLREQLGADSMKTTTPADPPAALGPLQPMVSVGESGRTTARGDSISLSTWLAIAKIVVALLIVLGFAILITWVPQAEVAQQELFVPSVPSADDAAFPKPLAKPEPPGRDISEIDQPLIEDFQRPGQSGDAALPENEVAEKGTSATGRPPLDSTGQQEAAAPAERSTSLEMDSSDAAKEPDMPEDRRPGSAPPAEPPQAAARHPIPPHAEQQAIRRQIDEAYKPGEAEKPEDKIQLADALAELAEKSDKPEEQFVLWRMAVELALEAGDACLMVDLIARMGARFELDQLSVQTAMLSSFAKKARTEEEMTSLVDATLSVVDEAVAADRIDLAHRLADKVRKACLGRRAGRPHGKDMLALRRAMEGLLQRWEQVQRAMEALKNDADDANAHTIVGEWHAFQKKDWERALPHWARGNDAELKRLAEQDLAAPVEAEAQMQLANAWWDYAEKCTEDEKKNSLLLRADYWYRKALPNLAAVLRALAERRIKQIEALLQKDDLPDGKPPNGHQRHVKQPRQREVLRPGEWADLLPLVDLKRDLVKGQCIRDGNTLQTAPDASMQLMLPAVVENGGYDLEVQFTRNAGRGGVSVIFPFGWDLSRLTLGGWTENVDCLTVARGWPGPENNPTARPSMMKTGQAHVLLLSVRPIGENVAIASLLDGQPCIQWSGNSTSLGFSMNWLPPKFKRVTLATDGSQVEFGAVRFRMVEGEAWLLGDGQRQLQHFTKGPLAGDTRMTGFHDFPPPGSYLNGLRIGVAGNVKAIQPIYQTPQGPWVSPRSYGIDGQMVENVLAKPEYAIGGLTVRVQHGDSNAIQGIRVTFMGVRHNRLDPDDSYHSEWIGGQGVETMLGGTGAPVIGIHGTRSYSRGIYAIGLIFPREGGEH